ncbi:hypothetical protein [Pimelobacter simplex]|uniref:hypothetical protein n=1 Tax=Nocardioides simplex TaxID=2045 RepID=UPI003AAF74DE
MTWTETHERLRIIREVEAIAAADMSGAVPWRAEWQRHFDGPDGLVAALRSRWLRMCEAQLDAAQGENQLHDAHRRLRRTECGVLEILRNVEARGGADLDVLRLAGPRRTSTLLPERARRSPRHGGGAA